MRRYPRGLSRERPGRASAIPQSSPIDTTLAGLGVPSILTVDGMRERIRHSVSKSFGSRRVVTADLAWADL